MLSSAKKGLQDKIIIIKEQIMSILYDKTLIK